VSLVSPRKCRKGSAAGAGAVARVARCRGGAGSLREPLWELSRIRVWYRFTPQTTSEGRYVTLGALLWGRSEG